MPKNFLPTRTRNLPARSEMPRNAVGFHLFAVSVFIAFVDNFFAAFRIAFIAHCAGRAWQFGKGDGYSSADAFKNFKITGLSIEKIIGLYLDEAPNRPSHHWGTMFAEVVAAMIVVMFSEWLAWMQKHIVSTLFPLLHLPWLTCGRWFLPLPVCNQKWGTAFAAGNLPLSQ